MKPFTEADRQIRKAFWDLAYWLDSDLDRTEKLLVSNSVDRFDVEFDIEGCVSSWFFAKVHITLDMPQSPRLVWEVNFDHYKETWLNEVRVYADVMSHTHIGEHPKRVYGIGELELDIPKDDAGWHDFTAKILTLVHDTQRDLQLVLEKQLVENLWEMAKTGEAGFDSNPFLSEAQL